MNSCVQQNIRYLWLTRDIIHIYGPCLLSLKIAVISLVNSYQAVKCTAISVYICCTNGYLVCDWMIRSCEIYILYLPIIYLWPKPKWISKIETKGTAIIFSSLSSGFLWVCVCQITCIFWRRNKYAIMKSEKIVFTSGYTKCDGPPPTKE